MPGSPYFVLDYFTNPLVPDPEVGPFLEIHEEDVSVDGADAWQTGDRFDAEIATPIEIEATPHHGYTGPPHDYFDGAIAFMSPRLVEVLRAEGVDNLDLYAAVITYRTTGERHPVFAFNLIGLVAAVDTKRSKLSSADGDNTIDTGIAGFAVDLAKAGDRRLFRLAENSLTVLAHARIKDAIRAAGIDTFAFVEPEHWTQL